MRKVLNIILIIAWVELLALAICNPVQVFWKIVWACIVIFVGLIGYAIRTTDPSPDNSKNPEDRYLN